MSKEIVVSAHQPNFLPYLGFFDKMKRSDIFVIRDEVKYVKKDFHRRNKIRVNSHDNLNDPKDTWLSVPVEDVKDYIRYVPIKYNSNEKKVWHQSMLNQIKAAYSNTPFFERYYPGLEEIFNKNHTNLMDLNMDLIHYLKEGILGESGKDVQIVFASELGLDKPSHYDGSLETDASKDLAQICEKLGASRYLSGSGGLGYLSEEVFNQKNIDVEYQDFAHPEYKQAFPGFVPNMCALDALFCIGGYPDER